MEVSTEINYCKKVAEALINFVAKLNAEAKYHSRKICNSKKHVIINLNLNLQRLMCQVRGRKIKVYTFSCHMQGKMRKSNLLNLIRNYGLSNTIDKWKDIHQHNQHQDNCRVFVVLVFF